MSYTPADDPPRHRYTVADYQRMGETGILAPDARVELIDGEIIDMPPIGFRHSGTVDRLTRILVTACGERAIVRVQGSVQLGQYSEPQPDRQPQGGQYTIVDQPDLDHPLAIETLPGIAVELGGLLG
jgi:Uma2 family endonuclease